jgi:hypothetical protein
MTLLILITLVELPIFLLSIIMIFYISSKKLNKRYLILPVFYLIGYLILALFGLIITLSGKIP